MGLTACSTTVSTGRTDAAAELRRQNGLIVAEARRPGRTRTTHEMPAVY
jgi:hypothetical protein